MNRAPASGEASALCASAKSRVPASITTWSGRNLRVAGLGVGSVRISISWMWLRNTSRSRTKRRGARDDPAGDREGADQAKQRHPPLPRPHWLRVRVEYGL